MLQKLIAVIKKLCLFILVWISSLLLISLLGGTLELAERGKLISNLYSLSALFLPVAFAFRAIQPKIQKSSETREKKNDTASIAVSADRDHASQDTALAAEIKRQQQELTDLQNQIRKYNSDWKNIESQHLQTLSSIETQIQQAKQDLKDTQNVQHGLEQEIAQAQKRLAETNADQQKAISSQQAELHELKIKIAKARKVLVDANKQNPSVVSSKSGSYNSQQAASSFCKHCGAKIDQDTFFCPDCGANLRQTQRTANRTQTNSISTPRPSPMQQASSINSNSLSSPTSVKCPICRSSVTYHTVTESNEGGCFTAIWYLFLALTIWGLLIVIPLMLRKKTKTVTYAVCQNCGHRWPVKS